MDWINYLKGYCCGICRCLKLFFNIFVVEFKLFFLKLVSYFREKNSFLADVLVYLF